VLSSVFFDRHIELRQRSSVSIADTFDNKNEALISPERSHSVNCAGCCAEPQQPFVVRSQDSEAMLGFSLERLACKSESK
jgi:hypothetical protein